jgi:pentatricopeptide repeat protein
MISGYSQASQVPDALELFRQMQRAKVKTDAIVIASVLSAFAHLARLILVGGFTTMRAETRGHARVMPKYQRTETQGHLVMELDHTRAGIQSAAKRTL